MKYETDDQQILLTKYLCTSVQ